MSMARCEAIRERIPDYVAGRLLADAERASVEEHAGSCAECRAELHLAELVFSSRTTAPSGLVGQVQQAVRSDRGASRRPSWALAAAAVAALALGIGVVSKRADPVDAVPGYAYELEDDDLWLSDDGLIAGGPTLEGLSDEALAQLLEELVVGGAGGAA